MAEFNPGPHAPGEALPEPEGSVYAVFLQGTLAGMADERTVSQSVKVAEQARHMVAISATRTEISTREGASTVFERV